jgi:hypothetical protein
MTFVRIEPDEYTAQGPAGTQNGRGTSPRPFPLALG